MPRFPPTTFTFVSIVAAAAAFLPVVDVVAAAAVVIDVDVFVDGVVV